MKRFAVIFESSPFDRKGLFNAVHNRVRHLLALGECEVDVYCVHSRDNAFTRSVRHTPETPDVESVVIDDVKYNMLWYRFSIMDHLTVEKLHKRPLFFRRFMDRSVGCLKGYDAVFAHAFAGGLFAYEAFMRFGTPYYVSWHGSDVHTHPLRLPVIFEDTVRIMENAKCNFFVSKALMEQSSVITSNALKRVLYNGVSEDFVRFSAEVRAQVRRRYGLAEGEKVVAFAGTLNEVKNVRVLPSLFAAVASRYGGAVRFWIAGDGKLRSELEASARHFERDVAISFLGNIPSEEMPAFMNCVDVLVLPSLNEGLPLVCAEALRCGANVAGSDVGGIAEVIGEDNVVSLGDGLVEGLASRVVEMLASDVVQELPREIDWQRTASMEISYYREFTVYAE